MSAETQPDTNDVIAAAWRKHPKAGYVSVTEEVVSYGQDAERQTVFTLELDQSESTTNLEADTLADLMQQMEASDDN